ncbi:arsenic metallochaperone ArsD family protein [Actinotalea ferrariae]|uniref:arsenic metallochaperone ArsD family protein n=1 Tax=Actinotalea ferrariae TaxID=1386098 RepID=UPI001C8BB0E4|nr:arsenic metallochaperone ArsD family protein [Actinotalea ferrariae]MBX9244107.1 arsenic metallochaperone ArsD family protein [Actinotalea ferrariae]
MTTVEVFAPTWCPAAYVEHDDEPEACHFAADVEWLAAHGVDVVRATLSGQPGRFVEHDAVRFLMNVLGPAVLPVVLVDGRMRWHGSYPTREQLAEWGGVQEQLARERAETALAVDLHPTRPDTGAETLAPADVEGDPRVAIAALGAFVAGVTDRDSSVPLDTRGAVPLATRGPAREGAEPVLQRAG